MQVHEDGMFHKLDNRLIYKNYQEFEANYMNTVNSFTTECVSKFCLPLTDSSKNSKRLSAVLSLQLNNTIINVVK